jgi:hypothetical protein
MLSHACNAGLVRVRQEDHEFEARMDYIVRPYLNKTNKQRLQESGCLQAKEEALEGTHTADTLILDFQPPDL